MGATSHQIFYKNSHKRQINMDFVYYSVVDASVYKFKCLYMQDCQCANIFPLDNPPRRQLLAGQPGLATTPPGDIFPMEQD